MELRVANPSQLPQGRPVPPGEAAVAEPPKTVVEEFLSILRGSESKHRLASSDAGDALMHIPEMVHSTSTKERAVVAAPEVKRPQESKHIAREEHTSESISKDEGERKQQSSTGLQHKVDETQTESSSEAIEVEKGGHLKKNPESEDAAKIEVSEAPQLLDGVATDVSTIDSAEVVGDGTEISGETLPGDSSLSSEISPEQSQPESATYTPPASGEASRVAAELMAPKTGPQLEGGEIRKPGDVPGSQLKGENLAPDESTYLTEIVEGKGSITENPQTETIQESMLREASEHLKTLYAQRNGNAQFAASNFFSTALPVTQSIQELALVALRQRLDEGVKSVQATSAPSPSSIGMNNAAPASGFASMSAERQNATPRMARTMPPALRQRTLEKVEDALKEVAKSKDGKTVSIRLDPPNLGSVKIDVSIRDGGLHARVRADTPQVTAMLREHGHELQQTLRKLGIDVAEVTVSIPSSESDSRAETGGFDRGGSERRETSQGSPGHESDTLGDETTPAILEVVQGLLDHWVA